VRAQAEEKIRSLDEKIEAGYEEDSNAPDGDLCEGRYDRYVSDSGWSRTGRPASRQTQL